MKTIKTVKATPNHRQRTFTIRVYWDGEYFTKYRTVKMTPDEFQSELNNTENDWKNYLGKSNNYYKV
jgi:hypothetical protein